MSQGVSVLGVNVQGVGVQGVYVLGVSVWGLHVQGGYVLEPYFQFFFLLYMYFDILIHTLEGPFSLLSGIHRHDVVLSFYHVALTPLRPFPGHTLSFISCHAWSWKLDPPSPLSPFHVHTFLLDLWYECSMCNDV